MIFKKIFFAVGLLLIINTIMSMPPQLNKDTLRKVARNTKHVKCNFNVHVKNSLNLLVLKVEFQSDNDPSTTGNGKMNLNVDPPHDGYFFEKKMENVKKYFEKVSNGRFVLNYSIYPNNDTLCLQMPHTISYYGSEDNWERNVVFLFHDAIKAADSLLSIDWADFDNVLIIHAGAPDATDIFGDSPNDITSSYIPQKDLAEYLGLDDGIPVNGGFVKNGAIISEDPSQDGLYLGGLGETANQIAHILGLPDLYDTNPESNGIPRIGQWGLMDFGMWNGMGWSPAYPSAWCLERLGWRDVVSVRYDTLISVKAVEKNNSFLVKIPINGEEYFLIENREQDPNMDSEFNDGEYDYLLPGSGILIWHIDNVAIQKYIDENLVNAYLNDKGVDLEEADGIDDLDQAYTTYSSPYDPFFAENVASFTPKTYPNTNAKNFTYTGIYVENISSADSLMSMKISFKSEIQFSLYDLSNFEDSVLNIARGNSDNNLFLLTKRKVYLYDLLNNTFSLMWTFDFDYQNQIDYVLDDEYLIVGAGKKLNIIGNNFASFSFNSDIRKLWEFDNKLYINNSDSTFVINLNNLEIIDKFDYSIISENSDYQAWYDEDNYYLYIKTNDELKTWVRTDTINCKSMLYGDYNNDNKNEIIVILDDGNIKIFNNSFELLSNLNTKNNLVFADINGDKQLDFCWSDGKLLNYTNYMGINYPNFSIEFGSDISFVSLIKKDEKMFLLVMEQNRKMHLIDANGIEEKYFPMASAYSPNLMYAYNNVVMLLDNNQIVHKYLFPQDYSSLWFNDYANFLNNNAISDLFVPEDINYSTRNRHIAILYPNPIVDGGSFWVKYYVENDNNSIFKIFDIKGNLLYKKNHSNVLHAYNEIEFDTNDISSGVYILIISTGSYIERIKFGVEK